MDISDHLRKLVELRDVGLLSPQEFEDQRKAVLARSLSSMPPMSGGTAPTLPPVAGRESSGATVGAYELLESIGEGGMGAVFRGRHRVPAMAARQGGEVAVKLLHTHLVGKDGTVERFRREAETLASMDHPNIVKVFDVVEEPGRFAIVMEWVPGRALSEVIGRETGPIPWERARPLVAPILDAVEHAHSRGVVHRDLKPDNIRVTPDGRVKVLDFGIARLGESRGRTKTGTGMGTVDYMAPEQYADAKAVDARADIYALGMTIYEMVAGRLPWDASETEFGVLQRKHKGEIPPPTNFYPSIPPWVVDAIMSALRPEPTQRLPTVAALGAALHLSGGEVQPPRSVRPVPLPDDVDLNPYASPAPAPNGPGITMATAVNTCFAKFFDRTGRASRAEYWWFFVFVFVGNLVAMFVDGMIGNNTEVVYFGFGALTFFPQLMVTSRRLHDTGRSGISYLLLFTCVGAIPLFFWLASAGDSEENKYGPAPATS